MKKLLIITFLIIYSCSSSDDGYVTPSVVVQPPVDTTEPVTVQYTLTVTSGLGGSVSSTGGTYDEGTSVTITASANFGFNFVNWTGNSSTDASISIIVNSDITISANFQEISSVESSPSFDLIYPLIVKEIPESEFELIFNTSSLKMNTRVAKIMAIVFPVGNLISEGGFIGPGGFNSYEVVLNNDQLSSIETSMSNWISTHTSFNETQLQEIVDENMNYINNGADVSSQFAITSDVRLVLIAAPSEMSIPNLKKLFIHETYHAFQQDLEDEICRNLMDQNENSNSRWIIEGGAEYFSHNVAAEIGIIESAKSIFMEEALAAYNQSVFENEPNPNSLLGGAIASRGAAAINLMIDQGFLTEAEVMNGLLFTSCARENEYSDQNSNIDFIKNNWFKIQDISGVWSFNIDTSESYSLSVTANNSSDYSLSGTDRNGNVSGNDPGLVFNIGDNINFVVDATGHPFYLKTIAGTGSGNLIDGVVGNGVDDGTVSWTPTEAGVYYYQCSLHGGMVGTITIE
jgi:plastocyanin